MNKIHLKEYAHEITKGTTPTTIGDAFVTTGINFVKAECLNTGKFIDKSKLSFITSETNNKLTRSKLKEKDLLFSIAGHLGKMAIVRADDLPANTNQAVAIIRVDEEKANIDFLYYYLSLESMSKFIDSQCAQSVQPNINLSQVGELPIIDFPIQIQKSIAKVLSDLDAKIELNNRINAELEAMAKTLYDYWFVQFDFPHPFTKVTTDKNGRRTEHVQVKPYKSSGGKMVYNKELKREIPEGWEVGALKDISTLHRGVSYDKDNIKTINDNDVIPILRATNINGNVIDTEDMVYVPSKFVSSDQLLNKYDILITMSSGSKDHIGKNGFFYFDKKVAFGAFCAKLVAKKEFRYYLYSYAQSDFMFATIKNECLGTNINNLNSTLVNGFKLIIPPNNLISLFNEKIANNYEQIANNHKQNQQLTELRDWLLPMLMNGQVRVK